MADTLSFPAGRRENETGQEHGMRRLRTDEPFRIHCASNVWRSRHAPDGWMMAPIGEWHALTDEQRAAFVTEWMVELERDYARDPNTLIGPTHV